MAFEHGKNSAVLVDQYDLSGDLTQYGFGFSIQLPNVTTFGKDDKVFLAGLNEGQFNGQGVWDSDSGESDEVLTSLDGSEIVISASPQGFEAIGDRAHMVNGFLGNFQARAPVNDAVRFTTSKTASAGAYLGVCLHHNNQESSTGDFASVDGTAQTTDGLTAFLHVTEFDGTDATITVEDSSDDAAFASLAAFSQVTGVGAEKVTATGTVEQYLRVALTGTFNTITFVVTAKRHRK